MAAVLVVEDDPAIAELVRLYLSHEGHAVTVLGDGAAALRCLEQPATAIDLVILDLMLPGLDGRGVCRRIRAGTGGRPELPVIMLTALDDDRDKLEGFDLGADDYLTKPFNPAELVARVRALLRRAAAPASTATEEIAETIVLGVARLDLAGRRFYVGEEDVALRTKEFDLLVALATRPGVVLTRDDLLARVWDDEFAGDTRTVDVHVSRLRDKLAAANTGLLIETVRSVGYRLRAGGG